VFWLSHGARLLSAGVRRRRRLTWSVARRAVAGIQHDGPLSIAALSFAWSAASSRAPVVTQEARLSEPNFWVAVKGAAA
jgi:hypothetical protein